MNTTNKIVSGNKSALAKQIGQMLILGFSGTTLDPENIIYDDLTTGNIGGVILFQTDATRSTVKNIENPKQLAALISNLKKANQQRKTNPPLFIAIDYEGGQVSRLTPENGFPATLSPAAVTKIPIASARQQAQMMAHTLQQLGFNLNFSPIVDISLNPENPVIAKTQRSFSAEPDSVIEYATLFKQAYRSKGILCTFKHFPGHGSTDLDSHHGFVDATQTWQPQELLPYHELLKHPDECQFIMTAHIINRQLDPEALPATLSYQILTKQLRQQLQFKGIIISDDLQMKAISNQYGIEEAIVRTVNAGADMLLFANQLVNTPITAAQIIDIVIRHIKKGEIDIERIYQAYQRINKVKQSLVRY